MRKYLIIGTGGTGGTLGAYLAKAGYDVTFISSNPGGESYLGYDRNGDPVSNRMKFSDKNIDELENIIKSISGMNSTDAAIGLILIEEMPSYFSGQKDLNDVVKIAQDRAQKVIGERG